MRRAVTLNVLALWLWWPGVAAGDPPAETTVGDIEVLRQEIAALRAELQQQKQYYR